MEGSSVTRFKEILKVFTNYGLGYLLGKKEEKEKKSPSNLRKAFEELGPTFIKIGQILSTRQELVPEEYIIELSKLQDNVPADDFVNMSKVFYNEFNKDIEDEFLYIDKVPIASASIAQVYRGMLKSGEDVVIKIQRPNIKETMKMDFDILIGLSEKFTKFFKDTVVDPKEILLEIKASTERELNFIYEAENIEKFRELNKDSACIYAPFIIHDYTGENVLTQENIEGFKVNDKKSIESLGYDRDDIAKKLTLSYFKQVLRDGFFHGDPHPGNILIREGKICFIDFGIVGALSKEKQEELNSAITAVANEDIDKLTDFVMNIGIKNGKTDRELLYKDIEYMFRNYYTTSLKNIKISVLFQEMSDIAKRNNLRISSDFTMLIRTMVMVEGLVAELSPELNIINLVIPYVKGYYKNYFFEQFDVNDYLLKGYKLTRDSLNIPSRLISLADTLIRGRTKINIVIEDKDKYIDVLNKMVNRLSFALVIAGMIVGSSLIININPAPRLYGVSIIGLIGYFGSAVLGLWLLISIIRSGSLK